MELRYLQTFRTVARLLSVTQAAAVLHYAQSSVSDHIHALEEEFGVKLFDRLGKRLVLTQAGHRLLDYADHMIRLTIDVAREAQAGRIAVLSWAGPELQVVTQMVRHKDKWLSPALQAFLAMTRDVLVGSQTKN